MSPEGAASRTLLVRPPTAAAAPAAAPAAALPASAQGAASTTHRHTAHAKEP
jgi:hypothetical protein